MEPVISDPRPATVGTVGALWRYPVKSMMGEHLGASEVTDRGLLGDRAYALVDAADGKVASAKNPRKWPTLFDFGASFVDPPRVGTPLPPVRITLPDGAQVTSTQGDRDGICPRRSIARYARRGRRRRARDGGVHVPRSLGPQGQGVLAGHGGSRLPGHGDRLRQPEGTFFDLAIVHVVTTATLERLQELYPDGRFAVERFRPNVVVQTAEGAADFLENAWIGRTLALGETLRLSITGPCPRCVMTTLAQGDLPRDVGILRTAAQQNGAKVGVYASVVRGGTVRGGDEVRLVS